VTFPWLSPRAAVADRSDHRLAATRRELRERSAMLARLGMSPEDATARLCARMAWEFDPCTSTPGSHQRPAELSDEAIGALVREVYASKRF
jgi:hypothetical protein